MEKIGELRMSLSFGRLVSSFIEGRIEQFAFMNRIPCELKLVGGTWLEKEYTLLATGSETELRKLAFHV